VDEPHSATAESFRALRTSMYFTAPQGGYRTVAFTSALPGEGKSFCAINYAVALAQQGERTLLIDADLRLPTVGGVFLGADDTRGLSEVLLGESEMADTIQLTSVQNLSVLAAGRLLRNPAEVLARAPLADLLEIARTRFDRVVIDTAPVHAVSETLLLAAEAEAVCLVVRASKTASSVARRAFQRLREANAHVAGFVLNGLPAGNGGYYYHYQAKGYGRDEVYGATRLHAADRVL
ncbi:MAG TPA: CpsD/CapB family tyrosine-protein kinase, partial [Chthoniobacterales bacterium]